MNDDVVNKPPGPIGNPVVDVSITEEMESRVFLDKSEQVEKALSVVPASETSRAVAYEFKKPAAKFTGIGGIQWNTQRDATNPSGEAREGVDEPTMWYGDDEEDENQEPEDLIEDVLADCNNCEPGDHLRKSFIKIGHHLAHAKAAHAAGDDEACLKATNRAIYHYRKVRAGINVS
jgi:hypothetical protein